LVERAIAEGRRLPLAARAQQPAMPVVGYLDFCAAEPTGVFLAAFRTGLSEDG
jgi:putative tryptophan/tyrosine transport system substrate-binding protein